MTDISVLTWNMGMGYRPLRSEGELWDKLEQFIEQHDVDVALLNEVSAAILSQRAPDQSLYDVWGTRGLDRKRRDWGTAIWSRHPITEIRDARARSVDGRRPNVRFSNSRPGSWTAGLVEFGNGKRLTCVSIYGLMDELGDASVHRALSDLSPLFSDDRYNERIVMGGDLNITTQYRAGHRLEACRAVLARIAAYGLTDCLADQWRPSEEHCGCTYGDDCRHTRTRLDPNQPLRPLQVDYVFASGALTKDKDAYECRALSLEDWQDFSDHAPIVFKVPGERR